MIYIMNTNFHNNNIFIGVFGYANKTPYRISTLKQTFKMHVDLLLISNSINFHYVLIKDVD